MNRLFVPLRADAFRWFESGTKRYELRRLGRQYSERLVVEGRPVELRFGYSGKSLRGRIGLVLMGESIRMMLSNVGYKTVVPPASNLDDAVRIAEDFVGASGPFILFEVKLDDELGSLAV